MTPDDFELMAFVDGELDPKTSKRIAEAVDDDPVLQAKAEALAASRDVARAAYAAAHEAPLSPALEQMMEGLDRALDQDEAATSWQSNDVDVIGSAGILAWASGRLAAMTAAGFAVGVVATWLVSQQMQPKPFLTFADANGTDLSVNAQKVLDRAPSGVALNGVMMRTSFISNQGETCRQFELADQHGVACLKENAWHLLVLVEKPESENFQAAGNLDPLAVVVSGLGVKHILTMQEEAARIENSWRPEVKDED